MSRIHWSPEAAEDLARIVGRIQQDNPTAARRVANTLYDSIASLESFPQRGRASRIDGCREIIFTPLPYIAVYRITEHWIEIARIYHGAQDWP